MDVIWHAANLDGLHPILPSNSTQEWPESFPQRGCSCRAALLRAENAMKMGADIRHTDHSAVPSGLIQPKTARPNVSIETLGYYRLSLRDGFRCVLHTRLNVVVAHLQYSLKIIKIISRCYEPTFNSSTQ